MSAGDFLLSQPLIIKRTTIGIRLSGAVTCAPAIGRWLSFRIACVARPNPRERKPMTDLSHDKLRALVEALRAPADLLQESDFDALLGLLKREYGDAASLPHMQHAGTVMQMRALWEAARAALSGEPQP
jgi:hypothetical protein